MPKFQFRAKRMSGEEVAGAREAVDRVSLARELRAESLIVVEAREANSPANKKPGWFGSLLARVSLKDKVIFAGSLGSMLSAGLSLSRALSVLARQSENKYFRQIIDQIEGRIAKGETLSQAISAYPKIFPEVFIAMIRTAEESGKLPEALKLASIQLDKSYGLRRRIAGALIYPAVILVVLVIIGILMMIFLVPALSAVFREFDTTLPLTTRLVIGASDFLVNHWLLALLFLFLVALPTAWWGRSSIGRKSLSWLWLHLPVINQLTRQANSATILRTASSLISSGVSMIKTIEICAWVTQNYYYRQALLEGLVKVQKGLPFSATLSAHQNLFPVFASEMTAVGEETGQLSDLLLKGAEFFEAEVDQATKNLSTVIEPILMILVGLAVGFFAISIISPMYSLTNVIK